MTIPSHIRILIAAERGATRHRLRHLLAQYADLDVVGEASNALDTLAVAQHLSPHVVLLTTWLAMEDGLPVAAKLRQCMPAARIIMLASYNSIRRTGLSGVDGYVHEQEAESIPEAIYASL